MPQTALANLGINAFYDAAADGWKAGVDNNWAIIDACLLGGVTVDFKTVSSEPGSPADGAVYILPATPTGTNWAGRSEGDIAIFNTNNPNNGGWTFITPRAGAVIYDRVNERFIKSEGGAEWYSVSVDSAIPRRTTSAGALTLGERSAGLELILDPTSNRVITIPQNSNEPIPIGTRCLIRNVNASNTVSFADQASVTWETEDPTAGGTSIVLEQWNWVIFQKTDTDQWRIEDCFLTGSHNTNINGFSATVNIDIDYTRRGEHIELDVDQISGTSNAVSKVSATALPAFLRGTSGKRVFTRIKDNGAASFSMGNVNIDTGGVCTFYPDLDSANSWTNSGTATIAGFQGGYARNL